MPHVRADLHCHSTASQLARLGVQRALALPECATEPEEVYELAKRRGMDFVTITDHDTIDGALAIADRPDVFVSVELTARFRGEPQAVHVLCWDITPDDHEWLQVHAGDVVACAEYLDERGIACALAHPFFSVAAPLTPAHRRRLARLFPIWETRNGSRARELNQPAAIYIETHGGVGVGGSDDHAGVDIGRTWTAVPAADSPAAFLAQICAGCCEARGDQGSAAKWTHAALAIAVRALGTGEHDDAPPPDPWRVLQLVERFMRDADERGGSAGADLGPDDARAILRAYLDAVGLDLPAHQLIAALQRDDFRHADLFRTACRVHERRLDAAVDGVLAAATSGEGYLEAALGAFGSALPALPYAPSIAFLGREKAKLVQRDGDLPRVALVADGVGSMHGVTHTLDEIRERGVPGFEVEVVGTDPHVDRRLPSVRDVDVPFYPGLQVGVPSLPGIVEALSEGRYDLIHVCSPGPAGIAANLIGHMTDLPVLGSYHTELAAYAGLRARDPRLEAGMRAALSAFYGRCDAVLSPSEASDAVLRELGIAPARIGRWDRGVDVERFRPELREPGLLGPQDRINVLYAGRLTREKGADLLTETFLRARARDPRLHLCFAGGGPEEEALRERLGDHATFLGWLAGEDLARAYASADVFLFASRTDTFGQVLLEAQASGLAVIAVDEGGPRAIVRDGHTGLLCPPDADALAAALLELGSRPLLRRRLAAGALTDVRERTWERSLERLADGYARALAGRAAASGTMPEAARA
ncbi:MAG TPA: glycosyltransferase [Solirubrobacteraceae bacterium]